MLRSRSSYWLIVLATISVFSLGFAGYIYFTYGQSKANKAMEGDDVERLVAIVSKLIVLPTDEVPTVATITNPERLRDQPFFANASKGDRVLLYGIAKKAILYNPSKNIIVEVAPISGEGFANIGNTVSPSPKASVKVEITN